MITKVVITGTKGKTTVTNVLSEVVAKTGLFDNVLQVNTVGHFLNGKQKSTLPESLEVWGLVPGVSPGRYLYEFLSPKYRAKNNLAVLEASLGSSGGAGTAYKRHDVGIFLNVLEDHIGSSKRLKTRQDIYRAKSFIFKKITEGGTVVLNADDDLVMQAYQEVIAADKNINFVLFGLNLNSDRLKETPCQTYITISNGFVVLVDFATGKTTKIVATKKVPWTFGGLYEPSLYNLMAIVSGYVALSKGKHISKLAKSLTEIMLSEDGGRLTLFKAKNGVLVLADYAHEKYSLVQVANLAKRLTKQNGRVIGVVRLAYDRTEKVVKETAQFIAPHYDAFVVYDKIDGYFKQAKKIQSKIFTQENGKTSALFAGALLKHTKNVTRIVREDEALAEAAKEAKSGDVVVFIVNDDVKRSVGFVKKFFGAKRIG